MIALGSFGPVWTGTLHDAVVAVKALSVPPWSPHHRHHHHHQPARPEPDAATVAAWAAAVQAVLDETAGARALRHARIAGYLAVAARPLADRVVVEVATEFVGGGSLAHKLALFGTLAEDVARGYLAQVLAGVAFLHAHGVVHGGLKAATVLLDLRGQVKLADYALLPRLALLGASLNHPPPAAAARRPLTRHADLEAAAAVLVHMLLGAPPASLAVAQAAVSPQAGAFLAATAAATDAAGAQALLSHPYLVGAAAPGAGAEVDASMAGGGGGPVGHGADAGGARDALRDDVADGTDHNDPDFDDMFALEDELGASMDLTLARAVADAPFQSSRYQADFEEVSRLGHGSFGAVVKVYSFEVVGWCFSF